MSNDFPPLLLAYVGDAVFDLYIRQRLVVERPLPLAAVHRRATHFVRAEGQNRALRRIEACLTPQEADIVRRGRNTKGRVPKNADMAAYRRATGFEALLGWLFLNGDSERLKTLLDQIDLGEENE